MNRFFAVVGLFCLLCVGGLAIAADPAPAAQDGAAYLGVLFGPLSDAFYDQLPQLPHDRGVLVTHVLADSPAEKVGLRRNDILLQYGDKAIRDCDDLVRLLQADRPGSAVKLTFLRGGKESRVEVRLALGPAIRTADEAKSGAAASDAPPGVAKPGAPAAVSVAATPLERGRLRVTIEYYPDGESRLQTVTCEGQPDEILGQVDKKNLSERQKGMVEIALKRIQMLNAPRDPDKAPPAAP
jgi:hypothetical protein